MHTRRYTRSDKLSFVFISGNALVRYMQSLQGRTWVKVLLVQRLAELVHHLVPEYVLVRKQHSLRRYASWEHLVGTWDFCGIPETIFVCGQRCAAGSVTAIFWPFHNVLYPIGRWRGLEPLVPHQKLLP